MNLARAERAGRCVREKRRASLANGCHGSGEIMRPPAKFWIAKAVVAFTVVLLGSSGAQAAGEDIQALQEALALLNQERQAVFQQFQMVQQLRQETPRAPGS
jgi:hypothetical protein